MNRKESINNQISFICFLSTMIFVVRCWFCHHCMCGHTAHGQMESVWEILNDVILVLLLTISLTFSLKDKQYKLGYYVCVLLLYTPMVMMPFFGLLFLPVMVSYHSKYHYPIPIRTNKKSVVKSHIIPQFSVLLLLLALVLAPLLGFWVLPLVFLGLCMQIYGFIKFKKYSGSERLMLIFSFVPLSLLVIMLVIFC